LTLVILYHVPTDNSRKSIDNYSKISPIPGDILEDILSSSSEQPITTRELLGARSADQSQYLKFGKLLYHPKSENNYNSRVYR